MKIFLESCVITHLRSRRWRFLLSKELNSRETDSGKTIGAIAREGTKTTDMDSEEEAIVVQGKEEGAVGKEAIVDMAVIVMARIEEGKEEVRADMVDLADLAVAEARAEEADGTAAAEASKL